MGETRIIIHLKKIFYCFWCAFKVILNCHSLFFIARCPNLDDLCQSLGDIMQGGWQYLFTFAFVSAELEKTGWNIPNI